MSQFEMCYYTNERREMLQYVPYNCKRVLEVGCGFGYFSTLVKERNRAELWGVEINKEAADHAALKLDKIIYGNLLENFDKLPIKYFDCIIFNDVIEHFEDPWSVLLQIKENLKDGGFIVASIPNVRFIGNLFELLVHKDWEYKEVGGILDKTHLRFFTMKSIVRLFESVGYTINVIKGINGTSSWKVKLLSWFSFKYYNDVKFLQFAIVSSIR